MRKTVFRVILVSLVVAALVGLVFAYAAWRNAKGTKLVFLDVGQGDAILISQGGNQILIDGGRNGKTLLAGISRQIPFWDRTIETVVATHPDADHIGGFPELFSRYRVGTYISTSVRSESESFALLERALEASQGQVERIIAHRGLSIAFPKGGRLETIFPEDGEHVAGESNETSVISRFSFGETDFLLTGDLPKEELFLPEVPPSEILKLAHHGSKHSSSDLFLSYVRPEEAVVSVGENKYGHPSSDVLSRVAAVGAAVRRTDTSGDIVYRCFLETNRCAFVP